MLIDTKEAVARIVAERFAQASPSEGRRKARKLLLELIQAGVIDLHAASCEVLDYPVFPLTDGAPAPHLLDGWDELAEVHAPNVIIAHADEIDFETGALSTLPLDTRQIEGWPYSWRGRCVVVWLGGLMLDADILDEALLRFSDDDPPEPLEVTLRTVQRPSTLPSGVLRALDIVPSVDPRWREDRRAAGQAALSEAEVRDRIRAELDRRHATGEPIPTQQNAEDFARDLLGGGGEPKGLRTLARDVLRAWLAERGGDPSKRGPRSKINSAKSYAKDSAEEN
ncbi:hypothetical protein [Xanthobacter aminoxidans]|uniref:hypothetical protein n=1 Tax=Xanthobacter aminoxidans TaxID=186280 RepID=UPI00372849CF